MSETHTQLTRTIVLVGHCGPDMFMLRNAVSSFVADAGIEVVNDANALEAHLHPGALLLVNRLLDGSFGTGSGIELIQSVTGRDNPPKAMLISNYDDAQQAAQQAGARRGFGKRAAYEARTGELLSSAWD